MDHVWIVRFEYPVEQLNLNEGWLTFSEQALSCLLCRPSVDFGSIRPQSVHYLIVLEAWASCQCQRRVHHPRGLFQTYPCQNNRHLGPH